MGGPIEFNQFLNWTPPKLVPIISHGLMYAGNRVIIYGKYKSLKSMLATRFCLSVSQGIEWLDFKTTQQSVLYIQLEVPNPMLHKRMSLMVNGTKPAKDTFWIWTESGLKVDNITGQMKVENIIEQYKPQVLVLDPVYKVLTGDISANENLGRFIDWVDMLVEKYQLSILMVHHSRKDGLELGNKQQWGNVDDMLGGSVLINWADTIIKVERKARQLVKIKFEVTRHAEDDIPDRYMELTNNLDFISGRKV